MNIKKFLNEYKDCPFCHAPLTLESLQADKITLTNNKLTISMKSDYFVDPNRDTFEFSISIVNGRILHTDATNKFISLYDLDILLEKKCLKCPNNIAQSYDILNGGGISAFSRTIKIFYDRTQSAFAAKPWLEYFSFFRNQEKYVFSNNYATLYSFIVIGEQMHTSPYIPFEKFNFQDEEKLFSKINSIMLLQ